ncbi:TonB-dependent receptor [Nibribacter ruber]|uniref:TonB-dependent receptor n=1 Tax=Nibribacter ruber TaxID=2698458 RepID=A0A6P1P4B5_9BACT|nr:TonB-dependent receptor [Nibribacter ruber]QHL89166.1 TonB-dependent receptor [Nibribacter ruber]
MKQLIALLPAFLFLLFNSFSAQAQGRVSGTLQDAASGQPVGFATAVLLSAQDSAIVASALVGAEGTFVLAPAPVGRYHVKVSFIGYQTRVVPNISVTAAKPEVNIGVLKLAAASTNLQAVEVMGQREAVEYGLDRRVYNVGQDLSTVGGTAVDVMQNVPSVTVDQEGTVSMRGTSNITILINGKPSALSGLGLDQIPASTIERVEVITNPSSKYDPSGTGGVLNIILKKEQQKGLNGMASVTAGPNNRYNTSLNLNYRVGKFNLFANHDFRQDVRRGEGHQFRTNYFQTEEGRDTTTFQEQNSTNEMQRGNHNVRFGADYDLTEDQSITAALLYRYGYRENEGTLHYRFLEEDLGLNSSSLRNSTGEETSKLWEYTLGYRKTFAQPGRELTADAVFNVEQEDGFDAFNQQYFDAAGAVLPTRASLQQNDVLEKEREFSLQADYVHPFREKGKWEAGYRSTFERNDADVQAQNFNRATSQFENSVGRTNHFVYDEWVHAVYGNYGDAFKKFSYQVGARLEQTNLVINQITQKNRNKRNYLNLFPSVFVTYDFSEEQKVQTSYSRRIDRPGTRQLNPFLDISDSLNLRQGNPNLNPEFIDSYEINYLHFWKQTTLTASVFYRKMTDLVQQVRQLQPDNQTTFTTYQNFSTGESYGLELTGTTTLTNWWRLNANASGFQYKINGSEEQGIASNSRFSWTSRVNSNFTLPFKTEVQLSANYRSPTATAQGERSSFFMTSLSLRKEVLKGKGNIILRVQDVLNTMEFNSTSASGDRFLGGFEETSTYKPQSRLVYVGFSYRFGNNGNQKKDREERQEENPDQQMGEGIQN